MVFTQYDGQEDGTLKPLPKKNIDTGMGLERMAALMQGVSSNYETDVMKSLISVGENFFNVKYGEDKKTDLCLRIIADHGRAVTFMIADGILPGNEGREYVLRRLLRRCVVKAYLLGHKGPFLEKYIDETIKLMGGSYPEIVENEKLIKRICLSEEERFGQTLSQGNEFINEFLDNAEAKSVIPGDKVFLLHDTYGFPMEVSKEIVEERGFTIDEEGFNKCMKEQVERARAANADDTNAAWDLEGGVAEEIIREYGSTKFIGYDQLECTDKILAIVQNGERVRKIENGQQGSIIVKKTPFYGEMGGQVGDTGLISTVNNQEAEVVNTFIPTSGLLAHKVVVTEGEFKIGDVVDLEVDAIRRSRIERNHSATHILHWALRETLGEHVKQAGSFVAPDRLRFDFTHFEAMTKDQLKKVEKMANDYIMRAVDVSTYNTTLKEARKSGVTALFGEKYGEEVRVVNIGEFSKELCGGCHVKNSAEIGLVKIVNESSVGANARRIEACTSYDAYDYCNKFIDDIDEAAKLLRTPNKQVIQGINKTLDNVKYLKEELEFAFSNQSTQQRQQALEDVKTSSMGFEYVIADCGDLNRDDIKEYFDSAVDHIGDNCAVVLAGTKGDKVLLMAAGTSKAVESGFDAAKIIKQIAPEIKGGGGGQPRMAQAGGKYVEGVPKALKIAEDMIK